MYLAKLKSDFGDKIIFNGDIGSHHTLIKGDLVKVKNDTRRVLETMMPGSVYIGVASHDTILEETAVKNVLAIFDAINEYGVYK